MNTANPETEDQKRELYFILDWYNRMPKYYVQEYTTMDFSLRTIYPITKMMEEIRQDFFSAQ